MNIPLRNNMATFISCFDNVGSLNKYTQSIQIPTQWFNITPSLPEPLPPPKDPKNSDYSRIQMMKKVRLQSMTELDASNESWVPIPEEVLEKYEEIGRPTPLHRAFNLEKYLKTPARIYFKREDLLPTASFKLNSAIAQAYYAKQEGVTGLVTETGAGQWALSVAYACNMFDLSSIIFWVRVSLEQKVYRATMAKLYGAKVFPSPGIHTAAGRKVLEKDPKCTGSLGTAIGEAINFAMDVPEYKYVSGSNLSHVLLHQSVIGQEVKAQLGLLGEKPDTLVACVGGGSNLGGFMSPFISDVIKGESNLKLIAAESDAAPRLTKGVYRYDHADPTGLTPLTLSYTLGRDYVPPPVHVGGLRQHSGSIIVGLLRKHNLLDAYSYSQEDALKAGHLLMKTERIVPAPESCHAILAAIEQAQLAKEENREKVIVACVSGNGQLDMLGFKQVLGV